ncbi:phosphoribosyl transferase [Gordonia phage Rabbitrun]|uniref:Phosphoribosyl transferase n=1 Tax=Gordonia phage Rabbitrun TaxID=2762280 RepID=A0A7G8LIM0_9CAUD|nr:phosphoribosyl transferase [Gordonia phage Rabbitrun]QNJ57092.1 phosphoribosyl transferase [Gordonia phage Rabbitrun]
MIGRELIRQAPPYDLPPAPKGADGEPVYPYDMPHYVDCGTDPTYLKMAAEHCLAGIDFDTVVGIGVSGAVALPVTSLATGKRMLVLRKPGVSAHSTSHTGSLGRSWVFVDDFIGGGSTFENVRAQVEDLARRHKFTTSFVGAFLYGYYPNYEQIAHGAKDHRAATFLSAASFFDRYSHLARYQDSDND